MSRDIIFIDETTEFTDKQWNIIKQYSRMDMSRTEDQQEHLEQEAVDYKTGRVVEQSAQRYCDCCLQPFPADQVDEHQEQCYLEVEREMNKKKRFKHKYGRGIE
jgi:hypothetical protein